MSAKKARHWNCNNFPFYVILKNDLQQLIVFNDFVNDSLELTLPL